jgi:hypothetical protein
MRLSFNNYDWATAVELPVNHYPEEPIVLTRLLVRFLRLGGRRKPDQIRHG